MLHSNWIFSCRVQLVHALSFSFSSCLCLSLLSFCSHFADFRFYSAFILSFDCNHGIKSGNNCNCSWNWERQREREWRMENSAELSWARLNWTQGRTKGGRCGNWQRHREGGRERGGWEWPNETQNGRCWRADRTLLNFGSLFWPKVNYLKCFLCACSLTVRLSLFPLQDIHYRCTANMRRTHTFMVSSISGQLHLGDLPILFGYNAGSVPSFW